MGWDRKRKFIFGNAVFVLLALILFAGQWLTNTVMQRDEQALDTHSYRRISSYAHVFRDPKGTLPFSKIVEQPFTAVDNHLNFGYTDDVIWCRLDLDANDFSTEQWLIQFGIPYLDQIDSYQIVDGEVVHYRKGRGTSLWTEPLPHRDSLIPIHFVDGAATIYLRIYSRDGTTLNGAVMTVPEFEKRDQTLRFFLGGYVGIMLVMAIYNFFIFLSLRDRRYGYYVFFTLAVLVDVAAHYELLHEYLFQGSAWLNLRLNLYVFVLAIAASIEFVRHFLHTQNKMPQLDQLLAVFHVPNFTILVYATVSIYPTSFWLYLMLLPLLVVIAICGIRSVYLGGEASSRYFLVAFALFITGVGMFSVRRFGFLAPNPFVNYTFMAGSVVETMLLSFALAHQINGLREQKQQAQQQLIQQISDHNASLEKMRVELEATVKVRTAKLRTSLEEQEMLVKEVHHRVKNNLAVIGSLLGFQILREEKNSPVSLALRAGQSRIQSMALVHELLCSSDNFSIIDVSEYFDQLSTHLLTSFSRPDQKIEINCDIDDINLPMDVLVACGLIATELLTNSLNHAFHGRDSGVIRLQLTERDGNVELLVADDGCGVNGQCSENLGMRFVRMMTEQLNGTLDLCCLQGSCWKVCFALQR